jgi:hypothetical protein
MLEARPEIGARDIEAVRFGYAVDAFGRFCDDSERPQIGVIAIAPVDRVTVIALAGDDDVAAAVAEVVDPGTFQIILELCVRFDPVDGRRPSSTDGLGGYAPERDVFFRDVFFRPDVFLRDDVFLREDVAFRDEVVLRDADLRVFFVVRFRLLLVSPASRRCLFTVAAAICLARAVLRPCFCSDSLMCSYCRARFRLFTPVGGM